METKDRLLVRATRRHLYRDVVMFSPHAPAIHEKAALGNKLGRSTRFHAEDDARMEYVGSCNIIASSQCINSLTTYFARLPYLLLTKYLDR